MGRVYVTQGIESCQEAVMPIPLLTPKRIANIAAWNIRTIFEGEKAAQVAREMDNHRISPLGLCETPRLYDDENLQFEEKWNKMWTETREETINTKTGPNITTGCWLKLYERY